MRRVFLDANVFVVQWVLDVLLCLAERGLLDVAWSEGVVGEYVRTSESLGRAEMATRVSAHANHTFPCATVKGGEELLDDVELPDEEVRHVIDAATKGFCEYIATFNTRAFPQARMAELDLAAVHPDELLMKLVEEHPLDVLEVMQGLVFSKSRPRRTFDEEVEGLRRCGLTRYARWLDS